MTTSSLHLSLEVRPEDDRIAGRLRDHEGNDWPFSSWLGLLTLIERLGASASSPAAEHQRKGRGDE